MMVIQVKNKTDYRLFLSREIRDINSIIDNCTCDCHSQPKDAPVYMGQECTCGCMFTFKLSIGDTTKMDGMKIINYIKRYKLNDK